MTHQKLCYKNSNFGKFTRLREKLQKRYFQPKFVEQVRAKNDIGQVVSSYIQTTKRGNATWALCPFHHEKTPSFAVNEEEQFFHCFGCGEGGDVIKFVQLIESISYPEAIEKLAERAGLEIPKDENSDEIIYEKKEKDEVLRALKLAMEIYHKNLYLPVAKKAQDYVKARNFKKSDLERFHMGYSDGSNIISNLFKFGVSSKTLVKAGIAGKQGERLYDKLSGRLIFPVLNSFGECVGFSGRILTADANRAKYKNTEQTIVFDKSSCVYAIDLLKEEKRSGNLKRIILVEGQIDVIKMHSFSFRSAVASMGTALTQRHATILKRFCDDITICYDGDTAGEKATARAIDILEAEGFNIKVARLPKGMDPDEFLKTNGREAMEKLLGGALSPVEYKLQLLEEKFDLSKPEGKANYLKGAFAVVSKVETMSEKDVYLKIISRVTDVPIDIVRRDCQNASTNEKEPAEKNVLITNEEGIKKALKFVLKSILNGETFSKLDFDLKDYLSNPLYISILKKFEAHGENFKEFLEEEEKEFVDNLSDFNPPGGKESFNECVWKIVENNLKTRQQLLNEKFKAASSSQERAEILSEINKIIKQLNERKI